MALASWVAFISLCRLHAREHCAWLYLYIAACVVGFCCLPSFVYFYAALIAFAFVWQALQLKAIAAFWKAQAAVIAIVFLFYTPCLCFSGLSAITANEHVQPATIQEMLIQLRPTLNDYMVFCFSGFVVANHTVDFVLFLLPLLPVPVPKK